MNCRLLLFLFALPVFAAPYNGVLSAPQRERIAVLARPQTITAAFTESRHTPLKKRPVVVTGTVRIDRERGLSLAYDQSRAPVVILDDKGLLLRHSDGREQTAPPDTEADLRLLRALFAFDLATLEKFYSLAATDSPDGTWTLVFTRLPDVSASYRTLSLSGDTTRLTALTLAKTANLKTEISIDTPRLDTPFNAEESSRYFR